MTYPQQTQAPGRGLALPGVESVSLCCFELAALIQATLLPGIIAGPSFPGPRSESLREYPLSGLLPQRPRSLCWPWFLGFSDSLSL